MGCCCNKQRYQWPYRYYYPLYPVMPNFPAELPAVFIRDNLIDVWFAGVLFERHIDGLVFQYDKGLKLNIRGLDTDSITDVEFTRKDAPNNVISAAVTLVEPTADDPEPAEDEEIDPEKLPYFTVDIPDELLTTPGQVIAYCVYKNGDEEYRTVKAIYITVHERQSPTPEEEESSTDCGCDEKIAALQETIAALSAKIDELINNAGG